MLGLSSIDFLEYLHPLYYCRLLKEPLLLQILDSGEPIGLKHFRPIKPLGSGDTGKLVFSTFAFLPPVFTINIMNLRNVNYLVALIEIH